MSKERCQLCYEPTSKAGKSDDSVFLACGTPAQLGQLCEMCRNTITSYERGNIEELSQTISDLTAAYNSVMEELEWYKEELKKVSVTTKEGVYWSYDSKERAEKAEAENKRLLEARYNDKFCCQIRLETLNQNKRLREELEKAKETIEKLLDKNNKLTDRMLCMYTYDQLKDHDKRMKALKEVV